MEQFDYLRFIASLLLVLGLILGLTWAFRRFGPHALGGVSGAKRRLSVVETLTLDAKHRLVLIRKDDRDHLLLLGGSASVIETSAIAKEGETG